MDHVKSTIVLMMAFLLSVCARINVSSDYEYKLDLLRAVMISEQQPALDQVVYYVFKFKNEYYSAIVDKELLEGAGKVTVDRSSEPDPKKPVPAGVPVSPRKFLGKLFLKKWFRVQTLLNVGLEIVQKSVKCLAYVRLNAHVTLINQHGVKEVWDQEINKVRTIMAMIIKRMFALQFTDTLLLNALKSFEFVNDPKTEKKSCLFCANGATNLIKGTKSYIDAHCGGSILEDKKTAKEVKKVKKNDVEKSKYSGASIINASYKKIKSDFDGLPEMVGMSLATWDEILSTKINDKVVRVDKGDDTEENQIYRYNM